MKARISCELCNGEAALHCSSDSAFLCWNCDSRVHHHNILVARHLRRTVCSKCQNFTGDRFSGVLIPPYRVICQSCSPESPGEDVDSSSSSSVCISSTEYGCAALIPKKIDFDSEVTSEKTREGGILRRKETIMRWRGQGNVESKAEGILGKWLRKLGVGGEAEVVRMCGHAFGVCWEELKRVFPFRVCVAASVWLGLRVGGGLTWQLLKRLKEISGVPAKLILDAESRLMRSLKARKPAQPHKQQVLLEEGWGECSV